MTHRRFAGRFPRSLLIALTLAASACSVADRLVGDREDYRLYRETRIAEKNIERLAASYEYLQRMPRGRHRAEVERWFAREEPRFFRTAYDRPSLLRAYLRAMPKGPHAGEVEDRLVEFAILNEHRQRREQRVLGGARRLQDELVAAEEGRKRLLDLTSSFVGKLGAIRSFGAPTAELDHSLIFAFRIEAPRGKCRGERCLKSLSIGYAVPEGARLAPREAFVDIALELERGALRRATFGGPDLFMRLGEAIEVRAFAPGNLAARPEAIASSVRLFENVLESSLPAAECERPPVAPVVLVRECRGVHLEVVAGLEPGADDWIEVRAGETAPFVNVGTAPSRAAGGAAPGSAGAPPLAGAGGARP